MTTNPKIKFGTFDGDPAAWTDAEAWVLTNGVWHEAEPFAMWHEARINVERSFMRQLIDEAPPLPEGAFAHGL